MKPSGCRLAENCVFSSTFPVGHNEYQWVTGAAIKFRRPVGEFLTDVASSKNEKSYYEHNSSRACIYKASWCIWASGHTMRTGPPLFATPHPQTSSVEHPRKVLPHPHPSSQTPHLPVHPSPSRSHVPVSVSSQDNSCTRNCVSVFEQVGRRQRAGSRTTTPRSSVGPYRNVSLPQAL